MIEGHPPGPTPEAGRQPPRRSGPDSVAPAAFPAGLGGWRPAHAFARTADGETVGGARLDFAAPPPPSATMVLLGAQEDSQNAPPSDDAARHAQARRAYLAGLGR
ncbi:hypothetical protein [Roseospirillum parvum]|uniref:Uncharacterized protein n=1 Tax=Roseospirillum parvum TaxID=83401 RepID=A0A1G8GB00_9PROT|nr:hypothetical protein [Roseospirillum parvum]SDH91460.1 hypothetical protein SAMN05421742_12211 [Roseospirillum parvum]